MFIIEICFCKTFSICSLNSLVLLHVKRMIEVQIGRRQTAKQELKFRHRKALLTKTIIMKDIFIISRTRSEISALSVQT